MMKAIIVCLLMGLFPLMTVGQVGQPTIQTKMMIKLKNGQLDSVALADITEITFKVVETQLTDYDGNVYHTVVIGDQEWMVENLRTTHYNDGTPITKITDNAAWSAATAGAYCAYNNNEANVPTYGYLYNWYAVDTKKLAPAGWRVPTDADWTKLTDFIGSNAGTKLKAKTDWSTNTGTDNYGFNALPGGIRSYTGGGFSLMGNRGYWWSSTVSTSGVAWRRVMFYDQASVNREDDYQKDGDSVRLVRDK